MEQRPQEDNPMVASLDTLGTEIALNEQLASRQRPDSQVFANQADAVSSSRDDAGSDCEDDDILASSQSESSEDDEHPLQKRLREGPVRALIEAKTICYCSNFDINVNEWFNEYENIEIFKLNMKKNLGKVPDSNCRRDVAAVLWQCAR